MAGWMSRTGSVAGHARRDDDERTDVPELSRWQQIIAANPDHSRNYAERFRKMEQAGQDLLGEARLVDAMAPRGARILDAGCGPGRLDQWLHEQGHEVVGVDVDQHLIDVANAEHPGPTYLQADLAELDLPARGIAEGFDVIVCAGNVMGFLAPSTRREVLARLRAHLREDGRAVIGFGAGRGYEFGDFLADAAAGGLEPDVLLESWDLRPYRAESSFLVAVLRGA